MAQTTNTHTGDGTTVDFSVTFEYIEQNDVFVTVNDVAQANPAQYSFHNATTIRFVTAPADGADILFYRRTDEDLLEARFLPGSAIRAKDLNANDEQLLFLIQENQTAIKAILGNNDGGEMPPPDAGDVIDLDDLGDVVITDAADGQILEYNGTNWVNVNNTDTLAELTDTNLNDLADGNILQYNGTEWVNVDNTNTLEELTDTDINDLANGQIIEYDGTNWVNVDNTNTLAELTDTTITNPSNGQILQHDGTDWKNVNAPVVANDGQINFNAGNGLTSVGDNATANQSGDTTKTFTVQNSNATITVTADGISVPLTTSQCDWNNTDATSPLFIQNKPDLSGNLQFLGQRDVTTVDPDGDESNGEFYINTVAGNATANWTGIAGDAVAVGDRVLFDGTNWSILSVGVTSVLAGTNIDVTAGPTPTVSLNIDADAASTATGSFQIAQGTTDERTDDPANGMIRYNTTLNQYEGYREDNWLPLGGGATGGGVDTVFNLNTMVVRSNYTLPGATGDGEGAANDTRTSASSVGPIIINDDVTVTIPDNQNWVIL